MHESIFFDDNKHFCLIFFGKGGFFKIFFHFKFLSEYFKRKIKFLEQEP